MASEPLIALPEGWPAMPLDQVKSLLTAPGAKFEMEVVDIRGVPTRVWKNAPPSLPFLLTAARAYGDRVFTVYEDERVTYDANFRAAAALARHLQVLGVGKGDRVAIAMRNLPEWIAGYYGALLCGAIATPLNAWWTGPELAFALADSGAALALVDGERLGRIAPHLDELPALRTLLVARPDGAALDGVRLRPLEAVTGPVAAWGDLPDRPPPDVPLHPDDDATIFYTSGTTGRPKGAVGTHRAACSTVVAYPYSGARTLLRRGEPVPAPDPNAPQKVALLAIPLFHVTGCHATLGSSLWRGQKLVMMRRWNVDAALDLIERERCTSVGGVPTIAWQILEAAGRSGRNLSSIEQVTYGGAPAAGDLVRAIKATLPAASPATGWGMTETSATFTHHQGEDYLARPESCGPPLPVCEVRVVGPDGTAVRRGAVGELWVKGPNVVRGYWNQPEATAQAFAEGWLRTGDLARQDAEGFLVIVDRMKDMLIRGGENIYCAEVENALYDHPAVVDAAVVPIPHPTLGEEPGAVVALADGAHATEEDLRRFVAARIAAFKVPVRIVIWPETLPRNPTGKILKSELKRVFLAEAGR